MGRMNQYETLKNPSFEKFWEILRSERFFLTSNEIWQRVNIPPELGSPNQTELCFPYLVSHRVLVDFYLPGTFPHTYLFIYFQFMLQ